MGLSNAVRSTHAAIEDLKVLLGARATDAAAVREQHSHDESYHAPARARRRLLSRAPPTKSPAIVKISARAPAAGHSVRRRHLARRPRQRHPRRHHDRSARDEPVLRVSAEDMDATVEAGVTRLQLNKALRNTGLTFHGRSRRRCDHRRHGGDARIGHDRRPLRHDARERAGADGRARRRPRDHDRHARAKVVGRLRPHAACSSDPKARWASSRR